MIGHSVHRSWWGHCMMARGLMEQHRQAKHEERAVPTFCLDYFFFGEENKGLPHLQFKDDRSEMCWASPIPAKGNDAFAVNFVLGTLNEVGYNRLILKSDNEPSIKALKAQVKGASKMDVTLEESKTGDHQSNGLAEVAVRETKRQCRSMKSSLQEKLNCEIDEMHPLLIWIARHSNFLMSRYRVGADGVYCL